MKFTKYKTYVYCSADVPGREPSAPNVEVLKFDRTQSSEALYIQKINTHNYYPQKYDLHKVYKS